MFQNITIKILRSFLENLIFVLDKPDLFMQLMRAGSLRKTQNKRDCILEVH